MPANSSAPLRLAPFAPTLAVLAAGFAVADSPQDPEQGLGKVPTSIVELYDATSVEGGMEIELARDGTILEVEATISALDLPVGVRRAARRILPGAEIVGGEREIQQGGSWYEVQMEHDGYAWEFVITGDLVLREIEQEIEREDAPAAVLAAADTAVHGGSFVSAERVQAGLQLDTRTLEGPMTGRIPGADVEYHVKKTRDGARYKIVVGADGKVRRKVREMACEIEIPLPW